MLKTFEDLKKNFILKPKDYSIDNVAFKLHYRITTLMLLVATILVSSRQYIGEHIRCISDAGVATNVMETFCFFTATFTVVKHLNATGVDKQFIAHPGVGPLGMHSDEPIKRHAYYQWVPFILFGQALMFFLTHLIWKKLEGGRLKKMVEGLQFAAIAFGSKEVEVNTMKIPTKDAKEQKLGDIRKAFLRRMYVSQRWSTSLIFCEFLNVVHVIFQVYLSNIFLGGQFLSLGPEIVRHGVESSVDPLDIVFPKVTKCTFYKYGPSGSLQSHDAMCVMALNIINEKIYIILWFWFAFLFLTSTLALLWRAVTVTLHSRSRQFNQMVFATACPGKLDPWAIMKLSRYCNFTDWLFLYYLSKNMDGFVFRDLFNGLANDLDPQQKKVELNNIFEGIEESETMILKNK